MKFKKHKSIFFILSYIFILITTFRGNTRDTETYKGIYFEIISNPAILNPIQFYSDFNVEFLFGIAAYITKYSINDPRLIFFFYSFFCFLLIYKSCENFQSSLIHTLLIYVSSFYITQQLMQMRQGLATCIAFYLISLCFSTSATFIRKFIIYIAGCITHIATIPILTLALFTRREIKITPYRSIALLFLVFLVCKISINFIPFSNLGNIGGYIENEYGASRSYLAPANFRSYIILFSFLIILSYKKANIQFKILTAIYCISVGIRIGFSEIGILSGRLGITFGFAEIFLIPMAVNIIFTSKLTRNIVLICIFLLQLFITLNYQTPYMIDDYFS